jgi:hypothetical protein
MESLKNIHVLRLAMMEKLDTKKQKINVIDVMAMAVLNIGKIQAV